MCLCSDMYKEERVSKLYLWVTKLNQTKNVIAKR
jgi:hypothetical protein